MSSIFYDSTHAIGRGIKKVFVNKATKAGGSGAKKAITPVGKGIKAATVNKATKAGGRGAMKVLTPVGHGLAKTGNWATGNTMLERKNLYRPYGSEDGVIAGGLLTGYVAGCGAAIATAPLIGPFCIPVGLGAAALGGVTPARLNANWIASKAESKKKKAAKAAKQAKP